MEPTWIEFAKQAPSLTVLGFIVVMFLRHIKDGERERTESEKQKAQAFAEVIERNTLALERNSEMFGRAAHAFDDKPRSLTNGRH